LPTVGKFDTVGLLFKTHFSLAFSVCVTVVEKFADRLTPEAKADTKEIEKAFKKWCKGTKGKENRFVSIPISR
jgi:Degradation arginine-rich protein for mis-folding.